AVAIRIVAVGVSDGAVFPDLGQTAGSVISVGVRTGSCADQLFLRDDPFQRVARVLNIDDGAAVVGCSVMIQSAKARVSPRISRVSERGRGHHPVTRMARELQISCRRYQAVRIVAEVES